MTTNQNPADVRLIFRRWEFAVAVACLLGIGGALGFAVGDRYGRAEAAREQLRAESQAAAVPLIVTCDSVWPEAVEDPRDPFLKHVIPASEAGCIVGESFGDLRAVRHVEIRFID